MRNLTVDDLLGLLEEPVIAVLATFRQDGTVLLSPVWHEWADGGFNVWVGRDNAKTKHLRRDPRTTIVVAESALPLRGVEVREDDVIQRIEPGHARAWDFADEYDA